MEMAKSRLWLTHFVSQNSDGKGDDYTSNYQYFETGIVPKSFRKKSKHDPDHSEYMCREHTCCSVNIHVLNSINNCFALEEQVGASFQCVTGKSHNHLWNVSRNWFTDRPVTPVPRYPRYPRHPGAKMSQQPLPKSLRQWHENHNVWIMNCYITLRKICSTRNTKSKRCRHLKTIFLYYWQRCCWLIFAPG